MIRMQSVRCFIAIDFDEKTKAALLELQRDILKLYELNAVRAVNSGILHLTLNFLGNITDLEVANVRDALRAITFHPFCVTLTGVGALPSVKNMRVIYVGFDASDDLAELNDQVQSALPKKYRSDRKFTPHVTLARVKKRIPAELQLLRRSIDTAATYQVGRCHVNSFRLKQSTLTPKGPVYETLEEFFL